MTMSLLALALIDDSRAGEVPYAIQAPVAYRCRDTATGASAGRGQALLNLDVTWDTATPPTRVKAPFQGVYWFGDPAPAGTGSMDFRIFGVTGPFTGQTLSSSGRYRADVFDGYPNIGDGVSFFSNGANAPSDSGVRYQFTLLLATPGDVYSNHGAAMPAELPAELTNDPATAYGNWRDGDIYCSWAIPADQVQISCQYDEDDDGICDHNEDDDGDGYGPAVDCDDANPEVNPGEVDVPDDGIDQNCDGGDMCYGDGDADGARIDTLLWSLDTDCDDAGEAHFAALLDCDDENPDAYPGAREVIGDGTDQDCNTFETCFLDEDLDGARSSDVTRESTSFSCTNRGETGPGSDIDCDDGDPDRYPAATDIPNDGIDQDCDGTDLVASTWADVSGIFAQKCTPCHTGPTPLGSGGLTFQDSTDLVGVSSGPTTSPYVTAGDPLDSFIYQKITNTQPVGQGARMPSGLPPLSATEIADIETWILDGALP